MHAAPQTPGFHDEINRLATEAAHDSLKHDEATRKLARRRPFSLFVSAGLALIVAQVVLLIILYSMQRMQVSAVRPPAARIQASTDCAAALHDTYWKVVAFLRDHQHLPANLGELLGKYVDKLPADPRSGKALEYSTDGKQFTVGCPGK